MGISGILIGTTLLMSVGAAVYGTLAGNKNNKDKMSAGEDFQPTMATEGAVPPIVYGRVRLPGNLIYWGSLLTESIDKKSGGKGGMMGGGKGATEGYRTYVDAWQAVCMGKVAFVGFYVNDKWEIPECADIEYNDGTQPTYPAVAPFATRLPGVAHVFFDKWYIGDNASSMPTIHFVVERILETPLAHQNLANGSNPAAVIYDLILRGGKTRTEINFATFQAAADYWYAKGIGLNLYFDSQLETEEALEKVIQYVDAVLYLDQDGKFALRALDPADPVDMTLTASKVWDFTLDRKTWRTVPNFFTASFIDEAQEFSDRTVSVPNPAAKRLAGKAIPASIDLKCFRDVTTASKRIWEIAKRQSYPGAEIKFKYDLGASKLLPGSVFRLSLPKYKIENATYRVISIDQAGIDSNNVAIHARQQTETLFDDHYVTAGGSEWEPPDNSPTGLAHAKLFELPYSSRTGFEPALLALAARENLTETKYVVLVSQSSGGDYEAAGEFSTWSQRGALDAEYNANTYEIDDAGGIYFTAYKDDPEFDSISRDQLYAQPRIAVIGSELIAFQAVTALGGGHFRLSGCIRGVLNTARATHSAGAEIFLTWISNNVFKAPNWDAIYYKIVPYFLGSGADPAGIAAKSVALAYKARQPRQPGRLVATRSGSAISVQIYPNTPGVPGAGDSPSAPDKVPPFDFSGDFQASYSGTTVYVTADNFSLTSAGAVDVTVKSRLNGYTSAGLTVSVGVANGEYIA